ncbi:protein import receptor MAS20 [Venturia nashicola]|uniref:Protein import receptor MAS20 n=1 Tax=Venturia nashicola TaxID=86259 RepID=A0A4Z1PC21_9PEZI|nr:protein import receptor MAS20 [Venturia nashicola]
MASTTPSIPTSTIITATIGGALTIVLGYAIYFDHKRRTDAEFRKTLRKESRKIEKAVKEEKEMEGKKRRTEIRAAVDRVNAEGVPSDAEEVEGYFMEEVAEGERLCQDDLKHEGQSLDESALPLHTELLSRIDPLAMACDIDSTLTLNVESQSLEAALCFFRALKVYPNAEELFQIYDKTVPKPILDILAEMIAYDPSMGLKGAAKKSPAATEFDDDV